MVPCCIGRVLLQSGFNFSSCCEACLCSGSVCDLCCSQSWRRAGRAEINDTFSCLFMVAPNPGTLSWMRNRPLTEEGGGGRLVMSSDRVQKERWKGLSQGLRVGQRRNGMKQVWIDQKVIKAWWEKFDAMWLSLSMSCFPAHMRITSSQVEEAKFRFS